MAQGTDRRGLAEVAPRMDVNKLETDILGSWESERIFERSLAAREGRPPFIFYDGPPYATGQPHYGHVLQSALKDAVLRYKTMRGFYVPRRVGWDTHGLPVEVLVEKELGLKMKKDIEAYGIEKFNQKCREAVVRYVDEFQATLQRLGRWADYAHSYRTLDRSYMDKEWGVFKALWDKKLIYQDYRSTPYCVRCATPLSNFETGMGYRERRDNAMYVKLKTKNTKTKQDKKTKPMWLLVWTTTPWTLPGNVAVAFNPHISYVSVRHDGEEYVMARERVAAVFGEKAEIGGEWEARQISELTYEPLFPEMSQSAWKVVPAGFVTIDEGTGLVHLAPAFGTDDADLAKELGLPVIRNVESDGRYGSQVAPSWLAGLSIWEANGKIVSDLKKRGHLVKQETYIHSYPHCWRCDEPLIYYALDSWFVRVTTLKQRMLELNEGVNWIPQHIKHGRFAKGIAAAPDWAVSRNRFWSTPMPVWQCEACGHQVCVGSVAELQRLSQVDDASVADLHRPYVDDITWPHVKPCSGTMRRIPEVLDVWFDSGSMPYATAQAGPADFIVESIEMTRAWFYVLHVLATALKDSPAYKNVIGSGIIFGSDGNKLSKKLKNYPEIEPTLAKYGADTVRLFFLKSTLGEPYVFAEKELQQLHRSFYATLWNVYSFFVRYANAQRWSPAQNQESRIKNQENILDQWITVRMSQFEIDVITSMETYRVDQAARALEPFVDDLSNWYVRRSRVRFHVQADPKEAVVALGTLHDVLVRLSKLIAPFAPFVSEEIYRNLTGEASVHLAELTEPVPQTREQTDLLSAMSAARDIVSAGLSDRAARGIKVRQPLARLFIRQTDEAGKLSPELLTIIREEVNVKDVEFVKGVDHMDRLAWVDPELTDELRQEGVAREIIRHGQVLRRQANLTLDERIKIRIISDDAAIQAVLKSQRLAIMAALQADEMAGEAQPSLKLRRGEAHEEQFGADVTVNGSPVHIGIIV